MVEHKFLKNVAASLSQQLLICIYLNNFNVKYVITVKFLANLTFRKERKGKNGEEVYSCLRNLLFPDSGPLFPLVFHTKSHPFRCWSHRSLTQPVHDLPPRSSAVFFRSSVEKKSLAGWRRKRGMNEKQLRACQNVRGCSDP